MKIDFPVKCLSPRLVTNKYNGQQYYVSCGHCAACELTKSYHWTKRVEDECKLHAFSIFFTLTYDNSSIPFFSFSSDSLGDYLCSHCVVKQGEKKELVYSESGFLSDLHFLQNDKHALRIGHLSKYDVQCFLKRLRIKINRYYEPENENENTKIRYFICGEYGSNTFRPHYHGIIWTDSKGLAERMSDYITDSWPYADPYQTRKEVSFVQSNASQYVAAYCNGLHCLPRYLQLSETKPFHICSKNPAIGFSEAQASEVIDSFDSGCYTLSRFDEQKQEVFDVPVSPYLSYKYFPKCRGFNKLDTIQRVQIYSSAAERARLSALERSVFKTCEGYSYISLDIVDKYVGRFRWYRLSRKDIMAKSKHLRDAAVFYIHKTKKTLFDFINCIAGHVKFVQMSLLKSQYEMWNDYSFNKMFHLLRYLYPVNFLKDSDCYLSRLSPLFKFKPFFIKPFTNYVTWLASQLKCHFDFVSCNYLPASSRNFSFEGSSFYVEYSHYIDSRYNSLTKFKRFNDSPISPCFKDIY